jgi:SAM-dependent methyltransferase
MQNKNDSWFAGNPYERFMGRWSTLIAREFLHWLPVPEHKAWLDIGCGTGTLSSLVLSTKHPKEILAIDSSPEFIAFGRNMNTDPRLRFEVALAQSLPAELNYLDAVISGLALNFVPEPEQAVVEMVRVAKPGGIVAAYVWDYAEGMQMLRLFWDVVVALDKNALEFDEAVRFPLCQETKLKKLFKDGGLQEVKIRAIEVATNFSNFDDYWQPFLSGVGPAPSYVVILDPTRRAALKKQLQLSLPTSENGNISLIARAWAIQGTV